MARVEMYSTMFCGYCARARALFQRKGVDIEEIDVSMDGAKRDEMTARAHGGYTVPQIFIDGGHIGGSDELAALDRAGKLDPLLGLPPPVERLHPLTRFVGACLQLTSGSEIEPNIAAASDLVRRARDAGADLVMTPEVSDMIEPRRAKRLAKARDEGSHPMLAAFRDLAQETGAWLLLGSLVIRLDGEERLANRSFLIAPDGAIRQRYDKIHMFDIDLPGGESYRESNAFQPGEVAALAALPWGVLGMTICYDLRFPQLYRGLAQAGADFLTVPSAFTVPTGRAHWHVLLRARAIETGCFVFAPAQCGEHAEGRRTYGHALIVAPWGEILAEAGEEPGFITAAIDPAKVAEARGAVPSLRHDRPFAPPRPDPHRSAAE